MPFAKTGAVYTTPDVRLVLSDAPWLADAAVSSWTVDRRLVASVIPGTLRQANGLSVGAASVKVINTESRVTPWSPDPDRLVRTDFPAGRLEVVDGDETLPLGAWVLNPVSGALSSREVAIELLEAQYAGKQKPQGMSPNGPNVVFAEEGEFRLPVDPMWVVGQMAAASGFPSVPRTAPSALIDMPLYGATGSVNPPVFYGGRRQYDGGGVVLGWGEQPGDNGFGPIHPGDAPFWMVVINSSAYWNGGQFTTGLKAGAPMYLTFNLHGTVPIAANFHGLAMKIVNDPDTGTHTIGVANNGTENYVTTTFAPGQSPDWPSRVQIEIRREWVEAGGAWGTWLSSAVRVRTGPNAAWSAPAIDSTAYVQGDDYQLESLAFYGWAEGQGEDPGWINGLQLTTAPDPELWEPRKAILKSLAPDGDMGLPWVPPEMDTWAAIQNICSAWLGAAIVGNDGVLRILTKDDLADVASGDPIVVDTDLADLPWDADPNDRHDRLEVTFAPAVVREADSLAPNKWAPIAWQAEDVIHVPPRADLYLDAQFDNAAATELYPTFHYDDGTTTNGVAGYSSLWTADNPDGTGNTASNALAANCWLTSPSTARVLLKNMTGSSVYIVTPDGDPALTLRAETVATYRETQTIARGKSAEDSTNPLAVDLTPWVQREQDATAIANYLWGRLSGRAWKVSGVNCRLDWTLDIGQIRTLTHPESGLESKVLITCVHYDGKPGQIEQSLDLVLIPWTYADFAAAWEDVDPASTYADFATAQGPTRTYADMSADDNWTGA